MTTYFPGTRVMVFDPRIYKDDLTTPDCIKPATVVRWYGMISKRFGKYPSLIDVVFDHDSRESRAHFADDIYVKVIQ